MKKWARSEQLLDVSKYKPLVQCAGVFLFFSLTVLLSHIRIPLPYTPVPLTLQVLAVFLAGYFLSPRLAAASMILYSIAGLSGISAFSGASGGILALAGPTGGYIIGFIPAAWIISFLSEKKILGRMNSVLTILSGIIVIYLFGVTHLLFYVKLTTGLTGLQLLLSSFKLGVFPFIFIDITKGVCAASLYYGLMRGKKLIL